MITFRVTATSEGGRVFMGQGEDLSDAVSDMSVCIFAAGTVEDKAFLSANLEELRKVAREIPEDHFGGGEL